MATRRVNSSSIEVAMANRRNHENQTKVLKNYVEDNTRLQIAAHSENNLSHKRRAANSMKLENERRIKDLQEERYMAQYSQEYDMKQSAALSSELERRKAETERKEREVRRICEESEELKSLERSLKFAYVNKERAAQHEERLLASRRLEKRERAMDEVMEHNRREAEREEETKYAQSKDVLFKQKEALQAQMEERTALREEAVLEAERDRELVDVVVRKIVAEDQAEHFEREKRKLETRRAIRDYEVQRKREVLEAKRRFDREESEIQQHATALATRERKQLAAKTEKKQRDAAKFAQIVAETERVRAETDELDALRDLLWAEEMEAQRRREEEQRAAKRAQSKAEMARANADMLKSKVEKRHLEAVEEERLVGVMRKKFAEDEAVERNTADKRKRETAKYIAAVNDQKAERHSMYEAAKRVELDAQDQEAKVEDFRLRVVREARRRLLADHADALRGFLPKGDWTQQQ